MESFIKQKEEYHIYKKLPKSRLILHYKKPLELNRNNGQSLNFEKPKKRIFYEDSLMKIVNNQNKLLSLNNTLSNNNISSNKSSDLPFDIKLLYKCKKYLKSLDNDIIKEREQLNKDKTIYEKIKNNNNSIDNNITNGIDNKLYPKYSENNDKISFNNGKISPINFIKRKDINNNIRTFKHTDEKIRYNRNSILKEKEKKLINLSEYSKNNKHNRIFDYKRNNSITNSFKGSLSTNNMNNIPNLNNSNISKVRPLFDFQNKTKENNNSLVDFSSFDKKKSILLHPIKNIKTFSVNNIINNNKKILSTTNIIIPKLPANNISEIDFTYENIKHNSNLKLKTNYNFLDNSQKQNDFKENTDFNNLVIPKNNIHIPIRKSQSSLENEKIYTRIFNTNTNTINDISSLDKENKINNGIDNKENNYCHENKEKLKNNQNYEKRNENPNHGFKGLFRSKRKTIIHGFFPSNKKFNNKFLDKIQSLNEKYPAKDAMMTHQIKLNKKTIIENHGHHISKLFKKQDNIKHSESEYEQDIKNLKYDFIEFCKNNQQELNSWINNYIPQIIDNRMKNCGLSPLLVHYIIFQNELSSIFIPLVDITEKRKSFLATGKLYIINQKIKVFEDKKSKSVKIKLTNGIIYQRTTLNFASKELFQILNNSTENINILEYESNPKQEDYIPESPKRYLTSKNIIKLRKGRSRTKKKKLTFIEKMTLSPSMCKNGIKPISILEKDKFFEVKNKENSSIDNNIENRFKKRQTSILNSNILKQFSHKPLDYINVLKQFKNKGDYFDNLKALIKKGEVVLFVEYFNDYSNKIYINQRDENGNTLLILAIKQRLNTICKLLMKNGIDVNLQNINGNSALHYALSGKNFVMADELRKYGAVENCKNKNGLSPWDCIGKNIDE